MVIIPNTLDGEIFRRKLQKDYSAYVEYANKPYGFYMTKFNKYLCDEIQDFLSVQTGKAMDILLLSVPPRHGKALPKDCPIFTPDGWRKHGDLKVGDRIYHSDGSIGVVTFVHPDYTGEEYEITFSTGQTIRCSPQHLWNVCYTDRSSKPVRTVTKLVETQDIFKQGRYLLERSPYICVNGTLDGPQARLPIDPYLLGLWLGDGYSNEGSICGDLDDLLDILPEYDIFELPGRTNFGVARHVIATSDLKALDLYKNKHIPTVYLTASPTQRLALLQGLMDTDGNISRNNCTAEICLANETLARDAYTLVRSLGYKAKFSERKTHNQVAGFEGTAWRIMWRPHDDDILFRLTRKQDILDDWSFCGSEKPQTSRYYITSVQKVADNTLANCITVDGDGTYLAGEHMLPTHNSFTVTETLPSWFLGKHPDGNVIICSYDSDFAEAFSRRNREKFKEAASDIFHTSIGEQQGVALWETCKGGRCRAGGLKAGITGYGADLFIIDDPIKNQEAAQSEVIVSKIHDEMGPSVQSRIHPGGKLIVIQTRWIENDVIGYIQEKWSEFIYKDINLPCECEDPENDPLGRKLGDSLMGPHLGDTNLPQRICNDNNWLKSKKLLVMAADGEYTWNALYQGHPSSKNGNLFDESWWQLYDRRDFNLKQFDYVHLSIDASFKQTATSDMVAMQVAGIYKGEVYLWRIVNKRLGFVATKQKIKQILKELQNVDELVIEDKANGSAIIDSFRYEDNAPPIVAVNPQGGKFSRAQAVAPFVEAGKVHIPTDWTEEEIKDVETDDREKLLPHEIFIRQHSRFPFAKHDDMVDANSQSLTRLIKLITGEEPTPQRRVLRYVKWYPDMWEDFERMTAAQQEQFIATYGAPLEWADY